MDACLALLLVVEVKAIKSICVPNFKSKPPVFPDGFGGKHEGKHELNRITLLT